MPFGEGRGTEYGEFIDGGVKKNGVVCVSGGEVDLAAESDASARSVRLPAGLRGGSGSCFFDFLDRRMSFHPGLEISPE